MEHQNETKNKEPKRGASQRWPAGKRTASSPTQSFASEMSFYVLLVTAPMLMLYLPEILWAFKHSGEPDQAVSIGTVQKVSFVGGVQRASQIETDSTRVLVKGLVKSKVGTALVQRNGRFGLEICEAPVSESAPCWAVIAD